MNRKYRNLADRILSNTVMVGECWCWAGARNRKGYGRITLRVPGARWPVGMWVHRVAYELFTGRKIPPGMTLDHRIEVCRFKSCWRPEHLEPVSNTENVRRQWTRYRGSSA